MKNLLLILFICIISITSNAQKIRISNPGNQWNYLKIYRPHGGGYTTSSFSLYYAHDTIFESPHHEPLGIVREDTVAGKIYFKRCDTYAGSDTVEQLLTDYNWHTGDVVHQSGTTYHVASIDSTMINGLWYKVWHFTGAYDSDPSYILWYNVIEGIGCSNGLSYPINPVAYYTSDYAADIITCFVNNGVALPLSVPVTAWDIWNNLTANFYNNPGCALATPNITKQNVSLAVSPNPISESSKIVLPSRISSGSLRVTNAIGQTIFSADFKDRSELLVGDNVYLPGIYYYQVYDKVTGDLFTGTFVK